MQNRRWDMHQGMEQEGAPLPGETAAQGSMTAQELSEELMIEDEAQAQEESETLAAQIREGIGMLFEDGWTSEELAQLSQDEDVRADIAAGKDVIRAAAAYLRRQLLMRQAQGMRRRGVPVSRASAAGASEPRSHIEQMSDAQFDAFSREARAAAMMGRKVRM